MIKGELALSRARARARVLCSRAGLRSGSLLILRARGASVLHKRDGKGGKRKIHYKTNILARARARNNRANGSSLSRGARAIQSSPRGVVGWWTLERGYFFMPGKCRCFSSRARGYFVRVTSHFKMNENTFFVFLN